MSESTFSSIIERCRQISPRPTGNEQEQPENTEVKSLHLGGCIDASGISHEWNPTNRTLALEYPITNGKTKKRTVKLPACIQFRGIRVVEEQDGADLGARIECYYYE